jgi:hypothetical protein
MLKDEDIQTAKITIACCLKQVNIKPHVTPLQGERCRPRRRFARCGVLEFYTNFTGVLLHGVPKVLTCTRANNKNNQRIYAIESRHKSFRKNISLFNGEHKSSYETCHGPEKKDNEKTH